MSEALFEDLDSDMQADLLTILEAATAYRVTEARIRQWKKRGHIEPSGMDEFGRLLFRGVDIARAEAAAAERLARSQARILATRHATPRA